MHLIVVFGPPAVGKMTVGRAIARRTDYRLFHNHMAVEPVLPIFGRGTPSFARLTDLIRRAVITEAVAAGIPGLILTYVWALDEAEDRAYVERLIEPVTAAGHPVDFVELYAEQATRLSREGTPERLEAKPSLRDQAAARAFLRYADEHHQLNSRDDFPWPDRLHHIDTTHLAAADVADQVIKQLGISTVEVKP